MTPLTPRQRQCLRLAADGLSNAEIAGRLGVCLQTVKNILRAAYARLGVNNRVEAAIAAGMLVRAEP